MDIAAGGGVPSYPSPQGVPFVKFDGESIATIKNFSYIKKFSHGPNTRILTAIEWFFVVPNIARRDLPNNL